MRHLTFDENQKQYRLAILVKGSAFRKKEIKEYYVDPLLARGFASKDIIAFDLQFNEKDKAPVSLIKEYLEQLKKAITHLGITHVLVADASYFKVLAKVRKAEPHYGYVLPSIWPGIQAALTTNYLSLFYNPSLKSRLIMGIDAMSKDINGEQGLFQQDLLSKVKFPESYKAIQQQLEDLYQYPKLTCDIETEGLHLTSIGLISISFAWSETEGCAFSLHLGKGHSFVLEMLKHFFRNYQGTLIYHNAPFDTKGLIYNLFMGGDRNNIKGMLEGLHLLHKNLEDTQILAYLSTNSTAGNKLSLKELAFEYTGNYALDEIENIVNLDIETVLRYNATDALATWYVYNKYKPVVEENQKEIYQNLFKPALKVITQMELVGMPFNEYTVKETHSVLQATAFQHATAIEFSPIIEQFTKELILEAVVTANEKLKILVKTEDNFQDIHFNPNSNKQLRKLLYEHLKLPVTRFTDTKLASTDGVAIDGLIAHIKNRHGL